MRWQLLELQDAYIAAIDDDRLEDWPRFFTDNALYEIIPKENEDLSLPAPILRCDNTAMMSDRVASLRHANIFEQPTYRYMISGLRVLEETGETAVMRTNYLVVNTSLEGSTSVYQAGIYKDVVVRTEAGWKFREKRVVYDTSRVQTLLAYPI
ncbi:anthranilate 1,2-dioxygenase small subunit AndAd [Rhodovarius sp.]|uniref:anthranilate 1,2-dioxygenase small subunit AndAd n=1 Tax=Rhodovarius sp. TaxID=2972673 RepID=UPI0033420C8B